MEAQSLTLGNLRDLFGAFNAFSAAPTTDAKVNAAVNFFAVFTRITPSDDDDKIAAVFAELNHNPTIHNIVVSLVDGILSQTPSEPPVFNLPMVTEELRMEVTAAKLDLDAILAVAQAIAHFISILRRP